MGVRFLPWPGGTSRPSRSVKSTERTRSGAPVRQRRRCFVPVANASYVENTMAADTAGFNIDRHRR